ncbi:MAG: exodeoxyribonuclease VII large subunit [Acidobacteriota bacterium]
MPDEIPSLAGLRRSRARKPAPAKPVPLSLFEAEDPEDDDVAREPVGSPAESAGARTPPAEPCPAPQDPNQDDAKRKDERELLRAEDGSSEGLRKAVLPAVFSVGELVRHVRNLVERAHNHVTVEGEISNWRPASSGHCYFTLKDAEAQLSIVLFRRQATLLRFRPKDGDSVRVSGSLSVYESRGQLQLVAETMQQTGLGAVLAATQALKERLRREGLFANARPLPPFPRCIGVVTSLQGAALRDIIKVCRRRHAAVRLLIYPASVQGPNCPAEVAAGVRWFSLRAQQAAEPGRRLPASMQERAAGLAAAGGSRRELEGSLDEGVVDVILVARGGGSWEDLHGFDAEDVARAIAGSYLPVITGIGHATDTTIADAAADQHAPTPSAAAEVLTAAHYGLEDRVTRLGVRLVRSSDHNLLRLRQRVSALNADLILRRTQAALERRSQRLDDLTDRAEGSVGKMLRRHMARLTQLEARLGRRHVSLRLVRNRQSLQSLELRLQAAHGKLFQPAASRLDRATARMEALSPYRVLERGYALVYGPDGGLLRDSSQVGAGAAITAQLAKGRLRATVDTSE